MHCAILLDERILQVRNILMTCSYKCTILNVGHKTFENCVSAVQILHIRSQLVKSFFFWLLLLLLLLLLLFFPTGKPVANKQNFRIAQHGVISKLCKYFTTDQFQNLFAETARDLFWQDYLVNPNPYLTLTLAKFRDKLHGRYVNLVSLIVTAIDKKTSLKKKISF